MSWLKGVEHGLVKMHTGGRAGKGHIVGCFNVNFEIAVILEI